MNISRKTFITYCFILLLSFGSAQSAIAANETEHILQKTITSTTPQYLNGREGNPAAIKGYAIAFDIFIGGTQVGTGTAEVTLLDPPANLSDSYSHAILKVTNTLTGLGSYDVTAHAISLGSSTTTTSGDTVNAWAGSISNGTGQLENIYGVSSGTAVSNIFTGTGEMTEVIRIRIGF